MKNTETSENTVKLFNATTFFVIVSLVIAINVVFTNNAVSRIEKKIDDLTSVEESVDQEKDAAARLSRQKTNAAIASIVQFARQ